MCNSSVERTSGQIARHTSKRSDCPKSTRVCAARVKWQVYIHPGLAAFLTFANYKVLQICKSHERTRDFPLRKGRTCVHQMNFSVG